MAQLAETYTEAHGISSLQVHITGKSGHRSNNGRSFNKYNGKQKQTDMTKPIDSGSKSYSVTVQQWFSNVRCHTCHGYGHMSWECGNKKPRVPKERIWVRFQAVFKHRKKQTKLRFRIVKKLLVAVAIHAQTQVMHVVSFIRFANLKTKCLFVNLNKNCNPILVCPNDQ